MHEGLHRHMYIRSNDTSQHDGTTTTRYGSRQGANLSNSDANMYHRDKHLPKLYLRDIRKQREIDDNINQLKTLRQ